MSKTMTTIDLASSSIACGLRLHSLEEQGFWGLGFFSGGCGCFVLLSGTLRHVLV